jgi:hypothetical protein
MALPRGNVVNGAQEPLGPYGHARAVNRIGLS